MGVTSRRRPARECQVGIESLDARAVPAVIVPTPGSPLLESGTGTLGANVSHVAFDEFGHGAATTTVPFDEFGHGAATTTPHTLAYRLPTPVQDGD